MTDRKLVRALTWLYARLVRLYPRRYQTAFAEEQQEIFEYLLADAARLGRFALLRCGLRELASLPRAILSQYIQRTASWWEALAAAAPLFLIALSSGLGLLPETFPDWPRAVLTLPVLSAVLILFIYGLERDAPRWFMPYLGMVGALLSMSLFSLLIGLIYSPRGVLDPAAPWIVRALFNSGFQWFCLLVVMGFVFLLGVLLPSLRPLYGKIRKDWTLLSFGLYGAAMIGLLLTFDSYPHEEPYLIASALILATGEAAYLRSQRPWRQVAYLAAAIFVTMAVTATGKAILYSRPDWPYPRFFTWQTEALSTLFDWSWLALVILSPGLLAFLARRRAPASAHSLRPPVLE